MIRLDVEATTEKADSCSDVEKSAEVLEGGDSAALPRRLCYTDSLSLDKLEFDFI